MSLPLSLLDLVPTTSQTDFAAAYRAMVDLAQRAEALGYQRYWIAEHHGHPGVASAATVVLIGHVLGHTKTLRVGAGGIMLPNHAPLVVAEQFGTLETLYPGRVDLALGRAPGTDHQTAIALRRHMSGGADNFPQDVMELSHYLATPPEGIAPRGLVRAYPGEGTEVPLFILGSSLFGAELAAMLGLPFGFASHFSPEYLDQAMALYRRKYRPSARNPEPHAIAAISVAAAPTEAEARFLFTTVEQQFLALGRGHPQPLQPPVEDLSPFGSPLEIERLKAKLAHALVGDKAQIREGLVRFKERSGADEIMVTTMLHDHAARCRSIAIPTTAPTASAIAKPATGGKPSRAETRLAYAPTVRNVPAQSRPPDIE